MPLALSLLLGAQRAHAGPAEQPLELGWLAPDGCPDQASLVRRVEQLLGYGIGSVRQPGSALASVTRIDNGQFRVQLDTSFQGRARERTVDGDSCDAVADAAALMIAFLIDPDAATASSEARLTTTEPAQSLAQAAELQPQATAEKPPRPAPERPAVTPSSTAWPAPRDADPVAPPAGSARPWLGRALVGADSGALPAATSFLGVALGRAFGRFSVELSGARFSPRQRTLPDSAQTRGGEFQLWALGANVGYRVLSRGLELSPSLGAELGTVYGSGFGVALPKEGKGLWTAATAGLLSRYRVLSWLGAAASTGVAVPITRPVYVLDNVGAVYQADFLAFRGSIGLEAYF